MEKSKIIFFEAYDLKPGRCIELNDLMKLYEYQMSRSTTPKVTPFSNLNFVLLFETKYHLKSSGSS